MGYARISMAALCLALSCGCTTSPASTNEGGSTLIEEGSTRGAQQVTDTALVIHVNDGLLFVSQDTGTPYTPGFDSAEVVDADGNAIDADALADGNVVEVVGNGIMLQSYPAQYPGITQVRIVDEGAPEDIEAYRELIDQLTVTRDPAEPAQASISYRTELAVVTLGLLTHGYTWTHEENGQGVGVSVDVAHPCQIAGEGLPDAKLDGPTTATAIFDLPATGLSVTRWSEKDIAAAMGDGAPSNVDPDAVANEDVPVKETDGDFTFTIEPGWRYRLDATFDAGQVGYLFTTR